MLWYWLWMAEMLRGKRTPAQSGTPFPPAHIPLMLVGGVPAGIAGSWMQAGFAASASSLVPAFAPGTLQHKSDSDTHGSRPAFLSDFVWVSFHNSVSSVMSGVFKYLHYLRASAGIASVARTGVSLKSQWRPQFPTSRGLTCGWEEHIILNSWEKWFWRLLKRHLGSGKNYLLKNRKKIPYKNHSSFQEPHCHSKDKLLVAEKVSKNYN